MSAGPAIDELFEPFRRLHPDRTGTADGAGLGLSIVAATTHARGGTVHATANPDGGLSITVALPALTTLPPRESSSRGESSTHTYLR